MVIKLFLFYYYFQNEDQQDQQETGPTPSSSAEQTKSNLDADNKQLRELVTSLHQKQQTTSLEVLTQLHAIIIIGDT